MSQLRELPALLGALAALSACSGSGPAAPPADCRTCEREVAGLKEKLVRAEPEAAGRTAEATPWKIVNYHDHLFKVEHADTYIPAARAAGVAKTVLCASSDYTIYGRGKTPEETMARKMRGYDETFAEIVKAAEKYPGEVFPQSSIYPGDPDALEMLKRHHRLGAIGLKLYNGHSNFYEKDKGLVPEGMDEVLRYCSDNRLPIFWHVRFEPYLEEFEEKVLKRYPDLVVVVAHYGVAFWRPEGRSMQDLPRLLDAYPNLYFDTSLGTRDILVGGLAMMSRYIDKFKVLMNKYPDRFTMGTDMVVTGNPEKTASWFARVLWAVRDQLEKDRFRTDFAARWSIYRPKKGVLDADGTMHGLALPPEVLKQIYETTPDKLLAMPKPYGG